MDKQVEKLAAKYPEIGLLRTAPGVGPIVAAAYVLTLDRPDAASNRSAGAFLGLRPGAKPVWRFGPAATHFEDRRPLPAQPAGAVGAIYSWGDSGPIPSCAAGV